MNEITYNKQVDKTHGISQKSPILSIIIVNYNVKEEILNCIQSIQDKIDVNRCPYEVIVSDNGSVDGSVEAIRERFPWVKIIENKANLGFGKANNIGAREAKGEVLFFLNPDTLIVKGIEEMVEYLQHNKSVGIIGPLILDKNMQIDPTTGFDNYTPLKLWFYLFFYKYYARKQFDKLKVGLQTQKPFNVEMIIGASMLLSRSVFDELEGFDEKFFLGLEDEDLCLRVREKGYVVMVFPNAQIVHIRGAAFLKEPLSWLFNSGRTTLYFYRKHYHNLVTFVYTILVSFYVLRIISSYIKKCFNIMLKDKAHITMRNEIIHHSFISLKSLFRSNT